SPPAPTPSCPSAFSPQQEALSGCLQRARVLVARREVRHAADGHVDRLRGQATSVGSVTGPKPFTPTAPLWSLLIARLHGARVRRAQRVWRIAMPTRSPSTSLRTLSLARRLLP